MKKINIYIGDNYESSTNMAKTCKESKERYCIKYNIAKKHYKLVKASYK